MIMAVRNMVATAAAQRAYPPFSLGRLLRTVFDPTNGKRACILIDLDDLSLMKDYGFLSDQTCRIQRTAHEVFFRGLRDGVLDELGMRGGEMYAYATTYGSNRDLPETVVDADGAVRGFEEHIYSRYDLILCISTYSATAPLTAFAKQYGLRGATMHGVNDVILRTGLSVDYNEVSRDAENLRLAMTRADEIEIDFALEDGRILTASLELGGQEAQKSHGLCRGETPDIANLPAGEVYFVPTSAHGEFPMKYEDGTLGVLTVRDGSVVNSHRISGDQETVDAHNRRLADDAMTGVLGELGFGTQILPYSGSDIQDEKILGTCHLATGRDDHLGGHIEPSMFKLRENATHDDILFAPHKTPNFDIVQARMRRGSRREILIEHFDPSDYLMNALDRS